MLNCTFVSSRLLWGFEGRVLAMAREADGVLQSRRAALGPLKPVRPVGTREPV